MNWYVTALKKYAVFSGRARRKEYWLFALFNLIASCLLAVVDAMTGTLNWLTGLGALSGLYALAVVIPSLAVMVRRLHDTGRSGWWVFIPLVPILGALVLLYFLICDSEPGPNRFGPNPKESAPMAAGAEAASPGV